MARLTKKLRDLILAPDAEFDCTELGCWVTRSPAGNLERGEVLRALRTQALIDALSEEQRTAVAETLRIDSGYRRALGDHCDAVGASEALIRILEDER